MRHWFMSVLLCCSVIAFAQGGEVTIPRTRVEGGTLYPRLIRLAHGPAETRGHLLASTNGVILRSVDDGRTFQLVTRVGTIAGTKQRCCATLYEMPVTVGSLREGTLVFSASYFEGETAAIEIYTSTDEGRTWTYLSTPVKRGGAPHNGLWEPEFEIAKDGALVMFWSDETDSCCSQKLMQLRTHDGMHWQDERDTVRSKDSRERPGMIVVNRLVTGRYFMSYEVCGPPTKCKVYTRMSDDGWNWGDASNLGTKLVSAAGNYFAHAPTNHVLLDGRVLVIGQLLFGPDDNVAKGNGEVLFAGPAEGRGPWTEIAVPVPVPTAYANFCPNYSSQLLQTADGENLIELTSDYDEAHKCVAYEAIAPLRK